MEELVLDLTFPTQKVKPSQKKHPDIVWLIVGVKQSQVTALSVPVSCTLEACLSVFPPTLFASASHHGRGPSAR